MNERELADLALNCGFDNVSIVDTEEIEFDHNYRKYCEDNVCGNYGKNYACPPYCGTPEEMEQKVRQHKKVMVLQKIFAIKNIQDSDEMKQMKKNTRKTMTNLLQVFDKAGIEGTASMPGGCDVCMECRLVRNMPCVAPGKIASCVSAYCIKMKELAEKCDMVYFQSEGLVGFFCLYLYD